VGGVARPIRRPSHPPGRRPARSPAHHRCRPPQQKREDVHRHIALVGKTVRAMTKSRHGHHICRWASCQRREMSEVSPARRGELDLGEGANDRHRRDDKCQDRAGDDASNHRVRPRTTRSADAITPAASAFLGRRSVRAQASAGGARLAAGVIASTLRCPSVVSCSADITNRNGSLNTFGPISDGPVKRYVKTWPKAAQCGLGSRELLEVLRWIFKSTVQGGRCGSDQHARQLAPSAARHPL
jgi:hypothetical protein